MNLLKATKEYIYNRPKIKKIVGIVLIFVGFVIFLTPFTPGSWIIFIGFELLGMRILFFKKLKFWKKNKTR